jgi:DNA recombination protein RmuC
MFIPVEILYLIAASMSGLLVGAFIMWLACRGRFAAVRTEMTKQENENKMLTQRLSEAASCEAHLRAKIESQKELVKKQSEMFEEIRSRAEQTFSALSSTALQNNNRYFLELAGSTFDRYFDAAKSDMEHKSRNIGQMVQPIVESLEKYDRQVQAMEQARQEAYGGLTQQVISLAKTQQDLHRETGKLVSALRLPHVRGRWGEMTLKRVVEIAGMQNHCDFFEQPTTGSEGGSMRPDMIVRLPGNRSIVIDAKVPITAYLDSLEVESVEKTQEHLARHALHVQRHIGQLSQKSYYSGFSPTPEFVVMFMPGENFFSAALKQVPSLIEQGANKGVILATPTTLITLLKTVAYGWRQDAAVENAREVNELAGTLYSRIYSLVEHVNRLGRDLDKCVSSYNKTIGSLERRVLVSARKFQEMGAAGNNEKKLDAPETVDRRSRQIDPEAEANEIGN